MCPRILKQGEMYKFIMSEKTDLNNVNQTDCNEAEKTEKLMDNALEIVYNEMNAIKPAPVSLETFKHLFHTDPQTRAVVQVFALKMLMTL
jgi:hypothetical protein